MESMNDSFKELRKNGYLVLRGGVDEEFIKALKRNVESIYAERLKCGAGLYPGGVGINERLVLNLQAKGGSFLRLLENEQIMQLVGDSLRQGSYRENEKYVLSQFSARDPHLETSRQQMHVDARYVGAPFALCVVVLVALDDFSAESGATWVVPGSHRRTTYPPDGVLPPDAEQISMKRGDVLIFDGCLWHGGGEKKVQTDRWAIIATFNRWWMKQSFDIPSTFSVAQKERLSPEIKELMGFNCITPDDESIRVRARSD